MLTLSSTETFFHKILCLCLCQWWCQQRQGRVDRADRKEPIDWNSSGETSQMVLPAQVHQRSSCSKQSLMKIRRPINNVSFLFQAMVGLDFHRCKNQVTIDFAFLSLKYPSNQNFSCWYLCIPTELFLISRLIYWLIDWNHTGLYLQVYFPDTNFDRSEVRHLR